jgi:hypothetical protein
MRRYVLLMAGTRGKLAGAAARGLMKVLDNIIKMGDELIDVARAAARRADDVGRALGPGRVHPDLPLYDGGKVQGILRIGDKEIPLISGESGPGRWLKDNLPGGPGSGLTRAWTHVEGHTAGYMHQNGVQAAELFINKVPCETGAAKCRYVLNKLLPEGSFLDVRFPNDSGGVSTWRFMHGVERWLEL